MADRNPLDAAGTRSGRISLFVIVLVQVLLCCLFATMLNMSSGAPGLTPGFTILWHFLVTPLPFAVMYCFARRDRWAWWIALLAMAAGGIGMFRIALHFAPTPFADLRS